MFSISNYTNSIRKFFFLLIGVIIFASSSSSQPLGGVYTIGGVAPNYLTISAAVSDLVLNGTNAPVTFNIRTGIYNETIRVDTFSRVNPSDVVIFQSETQNKNDVIIEHLHNYWTNFTVFVNGADEIQFKHLTIQAINPNSTNVNIYPRAVVVGGKTKNVLFEDNILKTWYSTAYFDADQHSVVVAVYTDSTDNLQFKSNTILGGFGGIHCEGGSSFLIDNLTISDNIFKEQFKRCLHLQNIKNLEIRNNDFKANLQQYYFTAVYVTRAAENLLIDKNKFSLTTGSTGISVDNSTNGLATTFQVSNNMICLGANANYGEPIGIKSSRNDSLLVAHNTVNIYTQNNLGYCFNAMNSDTSILQNNNFKHNGGGYCYYSTGNTNGMYTDYNNLYNNGSAVASLDGVIYNNIGNLFTILGTDQFSTAHDPLFLSDILSIPFNPLVYETGMPLANVQLDYYGTPRSGVSPDVGIYEGTVPNVDAGIVNSTLKNYVACPGDSVPFYVTIRNFGNAVLTSADVAFGTSTTIFFQTNWTGSLNQFQEKDSILLGYIKYEQFTDSALMVWSFNPNNISDSVPINDTLKIETTTALSGVYSIGSTLRDFQNITEAVNRLIKVGVCGPVTFNLDSGLYLEQTIIPEIVGASNLNNITFQSVNLDSSEVVIRYDPNSLNNFVLFLNGSDYISFKQLTFEATGTTYRNVVLLQNGANNNSFSNSVFTSPGESLMHFENSLSNSVYQNNHNIIANNRFVNGLEQLVQTSPINNPSFGNKVLNNIFEGSCRSSINVTGQDSLIISGNQIIGARPSNGTVPPAIGLEDCIGNIVVEKNDINISSNFPAIMVDNCQGVSLLLFTNNFVSNTKSCLRIGNSSNFKLIHNNFNHTGNTRIIEWNLGLSNIECYNNAFNCSNGGLYFRFLNALDTSQFYSDYNAFYSVGPNEFEVTNTFHSFANWKNVFGLDQNSVFTNIGYVSPSDLHIVNSLALYKSGTQAIIVTDDIDLESRHPTTPDIGADEFTIDSITYHDIQLIEILSPDTNTCIVSDSLIIKVYNKSNFPITSFDVKWWIYDTFDDSLHITQMIPVHDTITVNLGPFTFAPNTNYDFDFQIYNPNGQLDNFFNDNTMSIEYYHLDSVKIYSRKDPACSSPVELFIKNFPRDFISWSSGPQQQHSIIIPGPGTYSVTVNDNKGCTAVDTITIN